MQPDHALRSLGDARDLVDIQRRRIRGQDAICFRHRIDLTEQPLLELHALERRFDDQIGVFEPVVAGLRADGCDPLLGDFSRKSPLLNRAFVILGDSRHASVERGFIDVLQDNRDTRVRQRHRDPRAHGSRTDNRGLANRQHRRVLSEYPRSWRPRAPQKKRGESMLGIHPD